MNISSNTNISFKIKEKDFAIFLIVFSTFEISVLSFLSLPIKLIYLFLQTTIILLGCLNIFINKKYNKSDVLVLIFIITEFLNTGFELETWKELILNTKTLLLLYISFRWGMGLNVNSYINISSKYLFILTIFNTLSAFICYPSGLFYYDDFAPAFVLGADNTSTRVYIISIALCFVNEVIIRKKKEKIVSILSLCNFIAYTFLRDIGNGKMCSIVFIIAYLIFQVFKIPMINNAMRKVVLSNYILFFLMVIFNKLEFFSFLIVDILHRDLTLTTRTTIWSITIDKILENPFWGHGYISGEEFQSFLPSIIGINAHNTILMIAFIGGIWLSSIFIVLIFNLIQNYDSHCNLQKFWILPVAFFTMFLRSQVEGGDATYLIAIATLISSISKFIGLQNKDEGYI